MFKKTIKFTNFDGEVVEKDFYFHLSKSELMALAATANDLEARMKRIIATTNAREILKEFRELISMSCGVRSEDGQRFLKDPESQSQLLDSPAFDELLIELFDAEKSAEFFNNLAPQKLLKEFEQQLKNNPEAVKTVELPSDSEERPAWMKENRNPTSAEMMAMSKDELFLAWKHREQNS